MIVGPLISLPGNSKTVFRVSQFRSERYPGNSSEMSEMFGQRTSKTSKVP